ncbi:MAG TPA: hypothetical protein VGF40_10890 [Thermoanaerobaculia bacterium]
MKKRNDNYVDLLAQPEEVRTAVRVTEVTGVRTVFTREQRNVAILLSWDEYVALAETVRLAGDPGRLAAIRKNDDEIARTGGVPLEEAVSAGTVLLAAEAASALRGLAGAARDAALRALGAIAANPIAGAPLFEPLRGIWVFREDRIRIVYRVSHDGNMAGVVLVEAAEEDG